MIKKLFFIIPLLFLFLPGMGKHMRPLEETIKKKWKYVNITDREGNPVKQVSDSDFFHLSVSETGKNFEYRLYKENIHSSGTWELKDSLLVLNYDLRPQEHSIDSLAYRVENNIPKVVFFDRGTEVTRLAGNQLQSPHALREFRITGCNENELVFEENGVIFRFEYKSVLVEGGFSLVSVLRGLLGILVLIILLTLFSNNRRAINWKLVATGLLLQLVFALLVLKVDVVKTIFEACGNFFVIILNFTKAGSSFVFGNLVNNNTSIGFVFAFQILPTILFFSALTSLLFYLGILQKVVYAFAWLMSKTMKMSGAESLSAAGNIFLGQTESPLLIKPYIASMTKSELLCVMVGGMATIAGGVMAAYIGFLGGDDPAKQLFYAKHLLAASVMSAPAAIISAKILFPQTEEIDQRLQVSRERIGTNILEAISNGATDGLKLAVNVAAMLVVFIAMIALVNYIFHDLIGDYTGLNDRIIALTGGKYQGLTLQFILGYACAPLAWLMGTCREDMVLVGQLLGEKTILNEFVAYTTLGKLQAAHAFAEEKSAVIATYILCGFANFASIGIQIGGIGALAPNQRSSLAELGIKALIGGTIASLFTAVIVSMLI